jgi:hypothetical protein
LRKSRGDEPGFNALPKMRRISRLAAEPDLGVERMPPLPTPLEVILSIMRQDFASGKTDRAIELAKAAAPYLHAKATITAVNLDFSKMRDSQLDEYCKHGDTRESAANENSE